MKKCKHDELIDDYLLNKLDDEKKGEFEEHYFNCQRCFEKISTRQELIAFIQARGRMVFKDEEQQESRERVFSVSKITSLLPSKQWAFAVLSAALILILVLSIGPMLKKSQPKFSLDEKEVLRGETLVPVSPVGEVSSLPDRIEWKAVRENAEYKVSLYRDQELLWTASTGKNYASLPEEIRSLLQSGKQYTWQVKAFSNLGILLAKSSRIYFKITPIR